MNKFVRYTHDENGRYRNLPEWKDKDREINFEYIHMLGVMTPKSFEEIVESVKEYNRQFDKSDGHFSENRLHILESLVSMIEYDIVRVVKVEESCVDYDNFRYLVRVNRIGKYQVYDCQNNRFVGNPILKRKDAYEKCNKLNDAFNGKQNEYSEFVRV